MKKANLYTTSDEIRPVEPKDGKYFSLKELQAFVGGNIQMIYLPHGDIIIMNEDGLLKRLRKNKAATYFWKKEFPIDEYPDNNAEYLVGDVLITSKEYIEQ